MDDELRDMVDDFYTTDGRVLQSHERLLNRIIDDLPIPLKLALAVGITEN